METVFRARDADTAPPLSAGERVVRKASGVAQLARGSISKTLIGLRAGQCLRIGPRVLLRGVKGIELGSGVTLTDDVWLNVLVELGAASAPGLRIGDNVGLGRRTTVSVAMSVSIGDYSITAPNVLITDHNHAHHLADVPIRLQGITEPKPVVIGSGCWLGANAVVLPGSIIGHSSVVGANAVVRGTYPPHSLLVGNPARDVRSPAG